MQTTLDSTSEIVARANARLEGLSARMLHLFSFVPDDKLTWTPSPSSRSAIRLVAHCALTSGFFTDLILGNEPETVLTPPELMAMLFEAESSFTSREAVIAKFEENNAALSKALLSVTPEMMDLPRTSPFGAFPVSFWVGVTGDHLAGHNGQLEYIQTIWNDLDNHFG